jgi:hypothetical protein
LQRKYTARYDALVYVETVYSASTRGESNGGGTIPALRSCAPASRSTAFSFAWESGFMMPMDARDAGGRVVSEVHEAAPPRPP